MTSYFFSNAPKELFGVVLVGKGGGTIKEALTDNVNVTYRMKWPRKKHDRAQVFIYYSSLHSMLDVP